MRPRTGLDVLPRRPRDLAGQTSDCEPVEQYEPTVNASLGGFHEGGLANHGRHDAALDLYVVDDVASWDVTGEVV